MLTAGMMQKRH